jgi:ElaA protein
MELKSFKELDSTELYEILKLRAEVFVIEQDCNYLDPDGQDYNAYHLYDKKDDQIVSYARLYKSKEYCHIGRVLTSKSVRREGYGIHLMNEAIKHCKSLYPNKDIVISAQEYLLKFYGDFGFVAEGERYFEDNLPHFKMRIKLS